MFGMYRLFLALLVVFFHLGGLLSAGTYAVFGFYILSGYLMTLIMQSSYGYNVSGIVKYSVNRFLRIFPLYWVSILLTLVLIILAGEEFTSSYHLAMSLPETVADIFRNVFLFFPFREVPRLTPPAWALTVEIFFYILIGLGLSKNKKITCYWFILSLAYHVIALIYDFGWAHRYFTIFAASLPFATGAMIFHYKAGLLNKFNKLNFTSKYLPYLGYTLLIFNWAVGLKTGLADSYFFYSNYLICSLFLLVLIEQKNIAGISQKLDSKLGDFSYPIYLLHYQAGIIAIMMASGVGVELERGSFVLVAWSLPVLFCISWLVNQFVEKYVQKARTRIKAATKRTNPIS